MALHIAKVPADGWGGMLFDWRGSLWVSVQPTVEVRGEDATVTLRLLQQGPMPDPPKAAERKGRK